MPDIDVLENISMSTVLVTSKVVLAKILTRLSELTLQRMCLHLNHRVHKVRVEKFDLGKLFCKTLKGLTDPGAP